MKKLISIIILFSVLSSFAQAKFGMQMRIRSEFQNLNSTDADKQVYDRRVDFRFRPDVVYTINDYISVKAVFEIGDIQYGTEPSADFGTDGINLETKNAYIDVKPTKNHLFRLGLIPFKDAHSLVIDADVAGILWQGSFDKYSVELGWFAASDNGEKYIVDDTYSFGTTLVSLNQTYQMNKSIKFGIYNLFVMDRFEYMQGVNRDRVNMFLVPRFVGEFGKFYVDAQFAADNEITDYDNVGDNSAYTQPRDPEKTGLALSVKSKFAMSDMLAFRANLLFRGCEESAENYEAYRSFYDTGLEILNEDANGISTHNPMNAFVNQSGTQLGVVVPSVFADWKFKDNVTFTGGLGFVMNDKGYEQFFGGEKKDDMYLAMEIDLKAKVVLYDKIEFFPYMAFLIPSDGFAYNGIGDLDDEGEPVTDMQMKIGTTVKYNF